MASRISSSTSFSGRWSLISWCVRKPRVLPILMSVFSSWRRLATSSSVRRSRPGRTRASARVPWRATPSCAAAWPSRCVSTAAGSSANSASMSDRSSSSASGFSAALGLRPRLAPPAALAGACDSARPPWAGGRASSSRVPRQRQPPWSSSVRPWRRLSRSWRRGSWYCWARAWLSGGTAWRRLGGGAADLTTFSAALAGGEAGLTGFFALGFDCGLASFAGLDAGMDTSGRQTQDAPQTTRRGRQGRDAGASSTRWARWVGEHLGCSPCGEVGAVVLAVEALSAGPGGAAVALAASKP